MATLVAGNELRRLILGIPVEKSSGATTNGSTALFTISGVVLVRGIVGIVTVVVAGLSAMPGAFNITDPSVLQLLLGISGALTVLLRFVTTTPVGQSSGGDA